MFAVVAIGGRQYKVTVGDVIEVDRLEAKADDTITLDRVLLVSDGQKVSVGKPTVKAVAVKAKIVAQGKGEKIEVRRFKAKVRYRRHKGFRPSVTKLEILSIGRA